MQGPIGRFDKLAPQFFAPHKFDLTRIEYGLQRIFWGFFKKLILADRTAGYVNNVFVNNYQAFNGFYVIVAVLMYCVELYADFSGGMDIVIGTAEMFGITMDENFKRPFFSKSIGEFWRRWHVTLGEWMKDSHCPRHSIRLANLQKNTLRISMLRRQYLYVYQTF